jgi:LysR family glycine cleavage system transcriptional activator
MDDLHRLLTSSKTLFVFEAVARQGSFTAAASLFNVSQPSISRNIAQLEGDLGFRLFDRGPRKNELTPAGRKLLLAVEEGFGRIAETIVELKESAQNCKEVVTLSMATDFATLWFMPKLAAFHDRFPSVDLRFELVAKTLNVSIGESDLAMRLVAPDAPYARRWNLAPEIVYPVCSPDYIARKGPLDATPEAHHNFLYLADHKGTEWEVAWHRAFGHLIERGAVFTFPDYSVLLQAAIAGRGVALGWLCSIATVLLDGRLRLAGRSPIATGRIHTLVARQQGSPRSIVTEIATWLVEMMTTDLNSLQDARIL